MGNASDADGTQDIIPPALDFQEDDSSFRPLVLVHPEAVSRFRRREYDSNLPPQTDLDDEDGLPFSMLLSCPDIEQTNFEIADSETSSRWFCLRSEFKRLGGRRGFGTRRPSRRDSSEVDRIGCVVTSASGLSEYKLLESGEERGPAISVLGLSEFGRSEIPRRRALDLYDSNSECIMTSVSGCFPGFLLIGDERGFIHLVDKANLSDLSLEMSSPRLFDLRALASWNIRLNALRRERRQQSLSPSTRAQVLRMLRLGAPDSGRLCTASSSRIDFWDCSEVLEVAEFDGRVRPSHSGFVDMSTRSDVCDVISPEPSKIIFTNRSGMSKGYHENGGVWDLEKEAFYRGSRCFGSGFLSMVPRSTNCFVCFSNGWKGHGRRNLRELKLEWRDLRLGSDEDDFDASVVRSVNQSGENLSPAAVLCLDDNIVIAATGSPYIVSSTGYLRAWDARRTRRPLWDEMHETMRWLFAPRPGTVVGISSTGVSTISEATGSLSEEFCFGEEVRAHSACLMDDSRRVRRSVLEIEKKMVVLLEVLKLMPLRIAILGSAIGLNFPRSFEGRKK